MRARPQYSPRRPGSSSAQGAQRPALKIFLSYRRDDASGHAGRLYDVLADRFDAEQVFMDIDAIPLGSEFGDAISRAVASCDVLIALIGRGWLHATDQDGRRRIDNPDDYVRREIEAALARGVVVVPTCVQTAELPRPQDLPSTLAPMTERQGMELRDAAWQDDVARLMRRLEGVRDAKAEPAGGERGTTPVRRGSWSRSRTRVAILLGILTLAGASALALSLSNDADDAPFTAAERRLLTMIPEGTRPDCARASHEPTPEAGLSCDVGSTLTVSYYLFTRRATADAWYAQNRAAERVSAGDGNCTAANFHGEADYGVQGRTAGQYFCALDEERQPLLVARDRRANVVLEASVFHGTGQSAARNLLQLWACCIRIQPWARAATS